MAKATFQHARSSQVLSGLATVALVVGLSACGSGNNTEYRDNGGYYENSSRLDLEDFGVIDTQKRDSRSSGNLRIDYRNNSGNFSIYWDADFKDDYRATLYISPTVLSQDGRQIAYDYCGYGQICGFTGASYCSYGADYRVSCNSQSQVDFTNWISPAPRKLYLVLELCDTKSQRCESDSHEVTFY